MTLHLHRCRDPLEFYRVFLVAYRASTCETMCSTSKWKQPHSHWLKYKMYFRNRSISFLCVTHNSFNYSKENDTICCWLYYWVSISPFVPRECVWTFFIPHCIRIESCHRNFLLCMKSMRHMFERKTLWSFFSLLFEGSINTSHALHNQHLYWWNIYHYWRYCWHNLIRIETHYSYVDRRLYIWNSIMNRTY